MASRFILKTGRIFFTAVILFACAVKAPCEVIRPIQVMLPGNLEGQLITFSSNQSSQCSEGFKLPYVINAFKKEKGKDSIVFGIGNDSSAFRPFSYLNMGKAERELISRCNPEAVAVSPNDLEVFNRTLLSKDIKSRVFTNIEAYDNNEIFERFCKSEVNGRQFTFFCFIEPEYCSKLPIEKWSQIRIDDPCRAIRRLNPNIGKNNFSISIYYGGKECGEAITEELNRLEGIHFLVNIPLNETEAPLYSFNTPEIKGNVYRFSITHGYKVLPILNIIPKNSGFPRTTLRMIPLNKYTESRARNDFKQAWEQVRQEFHEPLRVIPITKRASTSANRIRLQAHAQVLRYAACTELAFIKMPDQIAFTENVMTVGDAITRFPNDRIIKFKATETQLKNALSEMLKDTGIKNVGFAGFQFSSLGGNFWDFKVAHRTIDKHRLYTIATTESTAKEFSIKKLLNSCIIDDYNGMMLWDIWKDNLKSFNISEDELFE